jgi:DNA-binding transcriptional regulator YhcF (GntR family)
MKMKRRGILEVTELVLKRLSDGKKHSVQSLASELKCQWKTIIKVLEFLKKIGLVKETKGKVTYKAERLFCLR